MFLHARQEPGHRLHKGVVVHHRVPLGAVQPVAGVAVVLRDDQRVGIHRLHPAAEFLPEFVVECRAVAQVGRHVQAPSVNAVGRGKPFLRDLHDRFLQVRAVLVVQLRQGGISPPALVGRGTSIARIVEMEVGAVGTVHALVSARLEACLSQIDALVVHPFVEGSAVVEHPVQDDTHAAFVQILAEPGEQHIGLLQVFHAGHPADIFRRVSVMLFPHLHHMVHIVGNHAEVWVNVFIILAVIFVAGGRDEDRIQIQHLYAEVLQVVQFVDNSLDIPAVKIADIRVRRRRVPVVLMLGVADDIVVFVVHHVVRRIPVAEPIRKDLVLHGALRPLWHMEPGNEAEGIGWVEVRHVVLVVPGADSVVGDPSPVRAFDQEAVKDLFPVADNPALVVIKIFIRTEPHHERSHRQGLKNDRNPLRAVPCHTDAQSHRIPRVRFLRKTVHRGFIAEYRGKNRLADWHMVSS